LRSKDYGDGVFVGGKVIGVDVAVKAGVLVGRETGVFVGTDV
jgi:hypothetical protein